MISFEFFKPGAARGSVLYQGCIPGYGELKREATRAGKEVCGRVRRPVARPTDDRAAHGAWSRSSEQLRLISGFSH